MRSRVTLVTRFADALTQGDPLALIDAWRADADAQLRLDGAVQCVDAVCGQLLLATPLPPAGAPAVAEQAARAELAVCGARCVEVLTNLGIDAQVGPVWHCASALDRAALGARLRALKVAVAAWELSPAPMTSAPLPPPLQQHQQLAPVPLSQPLPSSSYTVPQPARAPAASAASLQYGSQYGQQQQQSLPYLQQQPLPFLQQMQQPLTAVLPPPSAGHPVYGGVPGGAIPMPTYSPPQPAAATAASMALPLPAAATFAHQSPPQELASVFSGSSPLPPTGGLTTGAAVAPSDPRRPRPVAAQYAPAQLQPPAQPPQSGLGPLQQQMLAGAPSQLRQLQQPQLPYGGAHSR